jgi:GTPase SAR1 family protein
MKIGLTGTVSCGKTTLVNALKAEYSSPRWSNNVAAT